MTPCVPSAPIMTQPALTARGGAPDTRRPTTSATASPASSQPMSACSWVTPSRGSLYLGVSACPASGPVPVTTVPAASITPVTATSAALSRNRSLLTTVAGGSVPSVHLTCSTTAAATIDADTRKWMETVIGLSLVSTTIPPIAACANTPTGWIAASQTRSRRRAPCGRKRQAATNTRTVMTTNGKFSSRLPNSIQVLSSVCPAFLLATTSAALHRGQSGQPSPDELSRTAAPVDMITVLATTPASARRRIEVVVGDS